MSLFEYSLETPQQNFYNITRQVREAVARSGITDGITTNENADPDVVRDLLFALNNTFPELSEFRHSEGNSATHLKASTIGSSVTIIIENGKFVLGTWQGIYFTEFDPPRNRKFFVKIIGG